MQNENVTLDMLNQLSKETPLENVGLLAFDSLGFWVLGLTLIFLFFKFKNKNSLKYLSLLGGTLMVAWGVFASTVPTEKSEKAYKESYKEWEQMAQVYFQELKEQKFQGITNVKKLRNLPTPRPESGMIPIEFKNESGKTEEMWVKVVVDRDLKEPYIGYKNVDEKLIFDKDLSKLKKGHMRFYPSNYDEGMRDAILYTNRKP